MAECDVCYKEVDQWYQVSGFGCCSGLFCKTCKDKLHECPYCRSDIPQKIKVCSICAIKDRRAACKHVLEDNATTQIACDIYDDGPNVNISKVYCTKHALEINDKLRRLGLDTYGQNIVPMYGYSFCEECNDVLFGSARVMGHECSFPAGVRERPNGFPIYVGTFRHPDPDDDIIKPPYILIGDYEFNMEHGDGKGLAYAKLVRSCPEGDEWGVLIKSAAECVVRTRDFIHTIYEGVVDVNPYNYPGPDKYFPSFSDEFRNPVTENTEEGYFSDTQGNVMCKWEKGMPIYQIILS